MFIDPEYERQEDPGTRQELHYHTLHPYTATAAYQGTKLKFTFTYSLFVDISPKISRKYVFFTDLQYSADASKVSLLLKAPLYFDLEMFSSTQWLEKVGEP